MKRLVDSEASAESKALIDALRARDVDPFMETRVLGRVRSGKPRAVRWKLKPVGAFAAVAAIALASAASAMVWRSMHHPPAATLAPPAAPTAELSPPDLAPALAVAAPPAPLELPAKKPAPKAKPHATVVAAAPEPTATAVASTPALEESRLLLEAYRALRKEHDMDKARARVDEYLRRFPHGSLTEEALVIALDASVDDPRRAEPYAKRYLRDVPTGKHAARARAVLQL